MSTHDLELALEMDRVLVIEEGEVVFDGGAAAAVDHYRMLCRDGLPAGKPR
jgi:biotin transport system ATP-binding protein